MGSEDANDGFCERKRRFQTKSAHKNHVTRMLPVQVRLPTSYNLLHLYTRLQRLSQETQIPHPSQATSFCVP
jgi:hypothetical protein